MVDTKRIKAQGPSIMHSAGSLAASADASDLAAAEGAKPAPARVQGQCAASQARAAFWATRDDRPSTTCKLSLKISVFFDGTGNNMDADVGTSEHSNVARLFRSHAENRAAQGIYRLYVPGLGTYFKEIGDPGDEDGLAFAARGEDRLQWAMNEVDQIIGSHPAQNITSLRFALFGFSRGAAAARAFARRLQDRCSKAVGGWRWERGGQLTEIYFMGIFDTVASVGLPASSGMLSLRIAKKWTTLDRGLWERRRSTSNGVGPVDANGATRIGMAFGKEPGAIPTRGVLDGHMAWADDLRIPPLVSKCVHYTAGHEIRNSFPLDSIREGLAFPTGDVDERVYPGVHSNVGGGYRPGEAGKSLLPNELVSLIALNAMYAEAQKAGVPLSRPISDDFAISDRMRVRWNAYMAHPSLAKRRSTEAWVLAHMRLYYAWRFHAIHRNSRAGDRKEGHDIAEQEKKFRADAASLARQIEEAERAPARVAAIARQASANAEMDSAQAAYLSMVRRDWADPKKTVSAAQRFRRAKEAKALADKQFADADDERMRLVARQATLPGSGLAQKLDLYDRNLLLDVEAIKSRRKRFSKAVLRPHYRAMLEAYEAEFDLGKGLLAEHEEALAFFDHYIHDSLAGFAKDATLPSDPRVIYVGGDVRSEYARVEDEPSLTNNAPKQFA